ncbi:MAG: 2-succinyl-5-enolpyruvyl-6-hydroxy-3-cyclohexene-1-carboxylic-acid synthase [Lentimonas sp.]
MFSSYDINNDSVVVFRAESAFVKFVADMTATTFDTLARSTVNSAWGALTMELLTRLGVETVVVSPGSRSTPLTVAAARNVKLEAIPILDERSAGFFALGLAKRTRKPVALICTSGSAAANYYPAIVEASMSGTPLLILTADRPPELRDCSSGQTIDQFKIYGEYARAFYEVALPEVRPEMLAYLRQTLVHAVNRSLGENPGPIQLNFPFRDPLAPVEGAEVIDEATLDAAATVSTRPCESVATGANFDDVAVERLSSHQHGLIAVGSHNPRDGDEPFADAVMMLSQKLGWPVFCDVLNPLRGHASENLALVTHYDAFLRDSEAIDLKPSAILQIGALPTSKVLRKWLGELDAVSFLLSDRPVNTDPLHRVATFMHGSAHTLAKHVPHQRVDIDWTAQWMQLENSTAQRINAKLEQTQDLFEGKAAWLLSNHLPIGTPVFLASSMSVRYAEFFWSAGSRACSVFANRGANGIDGTLGAALGMAHRGRPAVLLTGDLAFLHDSNALMAAHQLVGSLTVVLINNNGGGIFEHLPVASMEATFEDYFATPQQVKLATLCEAHAVEHQVVNDWEAFTNLITRLPENGVRVLELQTDRKADRATLADIVS